MVMHLIRRCRSADGPWPPAPGEGDAEAEPCPVWWYCPRHHHLVTPVEKIVAGMRDNPKNVRCEDLNKVCVFVCVLLRPAAHHRWIPCRLQDALARRPSREHSERQRKGQAVPGAASPRSNRQEGGTVMQTLSRPDVSHYTYRVTWSSEDDEFVAACVEFPSLSWLAPSQVEALSGLDDLIAETVADMQEQGETVPQPLSERRYSGKFNLRVGESLHRRLAIEAAEEQVSINQLVIRKLTAAG